MASRFFLSFKRIMWNGVLVLLETVFPDVLLALVISSGGVKPYLAPNFHCWSMRSLWTQIKCRIPVRCKSKIDADLFRLMGTNRWYLSLPSWSFLFEKLYDEYIRCLLRVLYNWAIYLLENVLLDFLIKLHCLFCYISLIYSSFV